MRCTTCGQNLPAGMDRCPTCGAAVSQATVPAARGAGMPGYSVPVRRCPRCGYVGDGIPYFRRPGHVALLAGLSLFTYLIGGIVYWMARRRHSVCPRCGLGWEHAHTALVTRGTMLEQGELRAVPAGSSFDGSDTNDDLPRSGTFRRFLGVAGILFAALMVVIGIVETEAVLIGVGSVFGAAGSMTFWWGHKALQDRRGAVMAGMQRKVLRLAARRQGSLTVTEVAAEMDLSLEAAEKILESMDDGFRVRSDITQEGIIVYEFPEVQHRHRLGGASS